MMKWPWQRLERRDSSYTDALIESIMATVSGPSKARADATAGVEAAAGIVGRAFAGADVSAPGPIAEGLTPHCLNVIGRSLIRRGEFVAYLDVVDGALAIYPASSWDVWGDHRAWTYRLSLSGPNRTQTRNNVRPESVLHVMYASDPETPWKGIGPLQAARIAGRLSAETAQALADESSGPRGHLLGVPGKDGRESTLEGLRGDLRGLHGNVALIEDKQTWQNDVGSQGGRRGWEANRIGAAPPESQVSLLEKATMEVLAACGVPPELVTGGDGTALREGYRRLLHSTIAPLGRIVQHELRMKVHPGISLSFDSLFAADLSGRARAFGSMVKAGMDISKAATLAGLLASDE